MFAKIRAFSDITIHLTPDAAYIGRNTEHLIP